ncbi:hypothetical protein [Pseudomonas aeruginosa]|uniref:hypothetical protein n=1 Tax=Pseudomonas aeruginosa TaxID=287 RepID=UPI00295541AB|nr:hypothetical protein [Pseudomonas aeruginosa]MDV7847759.1 hypothetical protein [Pseudomonas aeruginosa]
MTKANECTCPSGDGSLRHPCPAHPAVEQAGGDERDLQGTQGERDGWGPLPIVQVPWNVFDRAVMWVEDRRRYGDDGTIVDDWKALKTIQSAALAQPSPVSEALIYACKNLAQITSSDGSGHADIAMAVLRMAGVGDDERERLVNEWKAARAWKPSPAQAEQAEAERPEVVARVVHSNPVVLDHCGPLNANDELMTVAQHAASVARWAEMFNRVEQERDAALARVASLESKLAELEKQEPIGWFAQYCETPMRRMVQWGTKVPDCAADTFYPLYAAPVAQAQHGVPGKYDDVLLPFLKRMEHELHANAGKGDRPGWLQMDRKTALLEIYYHLGKLQKATRDNDPAGIVEYAADVANMAMMLVDVCGLLAAAPGKEVGHE